MSSPTTARGRLSRIAAGRASRWVIPFLGYFLLFGAWAVATPYDGTPDEMRHIIRAYGVADGQVAPAPAREGKFPGAYHDVPSSLLRDNCFAFEPDRSAACAEPPGGDRDEVRVLTPAGRYHPAYYAAVGWPLRLSPDMTGVLLARLVNAALVAGLLAAATAVTLRLRNRGVLAGLLVAVTPMTAHLAGAINPNGVEIAAGAALVVALIAILLEPDGAGRRAAPWWLAGIAGATLVTVRSAGPAWLAVIALVMLVPLSLARYRQLLRSRRMWLLAGALAAAGLASVGWTLWKRSNELIPNALYKGHLGIVDAMKIEIFDKWRRYFTEMIGVMSWLDTPLPPVIHLVWWLSVGALLLPAVALCRPAQRWRVAGLALLAMLVPSLLEAVNVNTYGFVAQGRYYLALLAGVPILAGYFLAGLPNFDPTPRLTRLLALLLLPAHLASLFYLMVRYQTGLPDGAFIVSLNPLAGSWHPQVGSLTPVLMGIAAVVVLVAWHFRVTATPAPAAAGPTDGTGSGDNGTAPQATTSHTVPVHDLQRPMVVAAGQHQPEERP
ncbi:DUF2142 domain-containing protein [Polymorphospora sp. NPDC050346]|uniref:DUF2142 domain-containing protein n=1 Tax=Polymorphospora sp. NPDC050346 TaxID=3155780 RepID=UPI0033D96883